MTTTTVLDPGAEQGPKMCVATDPSRRKCHNDEAGYLFQRNHPLVPGAHLVVYNAYQQGLDPAGGRYAVVCEVHGTICNTTIRRVAYDVVTDPLNFCDGCRDLAEARQ